MSVITIQLGQCGNSIGTEVFRLLSENVAGPNHSKEYVEETFTRYFRPSYGKDKQTTPTARALMVDTEPKVIVAQQERAKNSSLFRFATHTPYSSQSGAANNWAYGYSVHGNSCSESLQNSLRKETEHADRLNGFLLLHSLAGGTGSGLGTRAAEIIRDEYSKSTILSHVVWPYLQGEVCVQNYNAILAIGRLYDVVDSILVTKNDDIHTMCETTYGLKKVSTSDLNEVIGSQLAHVLLPAYGASNMLSFDDISRTLCYHPLYKFASMFSVPQQPVSSREFNSHLWPGLVGHLRQMVATNSAVDLALDWSLQLPTLESVSHSKMNSRKISNKSIANLVVLRGDGAEDAGIDTVSTNLFGCRSLYSNRVLGNVSIEPWNRSNGVPLSVFAHPTRFGRLDKSAVAVSNSQFLIEPFEAILNRASDMLSARAFLHRYELYGVSLDDVVSMTARCEQIVSDYQAL